MLQFLSGEKTNFGHTKLHASLQKDQFRVTDSDKYYLISPFLTKKLKRIRKSKAKSCSITLNNWEFVVDKQSLDFRFDDFEVETDSEHQQSKGKDLTKLPSVSKALQHFLSKNSSKNNHKETEGKEAKEENRIELNEVGKTGFNGEQFIDPKDIFFAREFEADIPKLTVSRLRNFSLKEEELSQR